MPYQNFISIITSSLIISAAFLLFVRFKAIVGFATRILANQSIKTAIIALAAILAVVAGYNHFSQPSTYEECVQKYVNKAQTSQAAKMQGLACRKQFPDENPFAKFGYAPDGK